MFEAVRERLAGLRGDPADDCRCEVTFEDAVGVQGRDRTALRVAAGDCPGGGDLSTAPACRATVVGALAGRDAAVVHVRADGLERTYDGAAAGLLRAAGRFADRIAVHDATLAERTRRDPLAAARAAAGRAGPAPTVASDTGFAGAADAVAGYDALRPLVAPTVARSRVRPTPPPDATLRDRYDLDTGGVVRLYDTPAGPRYHLRPVSLSLSPGGPAALSRAADLVAAGAVDGGARAAGRAVRRIVGSEADPSSGADRPVDATNPSNSGAAKGDASDADAAGAGGVDVERLTAVLRRYTAGHGVFEHLFADPRVSDAFATAPVTDNPIRVAVDGRRVPTNLRVTPDGAAALASHLRRTSGRPFSRAAPTLDAVVSPRGSDDRIRVAGVAPPASEGLGFAFRSHGGDAFTLPALVANGSLTARAAAVCSVAVERGGAVLVAGPRGAGKTTTLGALLFELPANTRTVVVEDTPELPVESLRSVGRDVQPLWTTTDEGPELSPTAAVRTALRLGKGALVVGEVRGREAAALYEAMRVGAAESAVLGTVHGEGAAAVRERVVSDLDVPASSFAATDLIVSCAVGRRGTRHVAAIEEVRDPAGGAVGFESLFDTRAGSGGGESGPGTAAGPTAVATGVIDRGNSHLLDRLRRPDEPYAAVREAVADRADRLESLAVSGRTTPEEVVRAARTAGRHDDAWAGGAA